MQHFVRLLPYERWHSMPTTLWVQTQSRQPGARVPVLIEWKVAPVGSFNEENLMLTHVSDWDSRLTALDGTDSRLAGVSME